MKRFVVALLVTSLLACSGYAQQAADPQLPAYQDRGYVLNQEGGMLVAAPGLVVALRAADGLWVFQNADTAILVWRDSTFMGAAKGFVTEEVARSRNPTTVPPEQFGPVGFVFLLKVPHEDHEDIYAGIVYRP